MRKLFSFLLGISLLTTSCNNTSEGGVNSQAADGSDQVEKFKKEVMEVHDRVMPQMGTVKSLMSEISKLEVRNDKDSVSFAAAFSNLKKADDGMMNWMHEFDGQSLNGDTWSTEEKINYLKGEMITISQVEKDFETSLANARNILETFSNDSIHE